MTQIPEPHINCGSRKVRVSEPLQCIGTEQTVLKKQDGNHEPECSHVILRWTGHNRITVHLSAFLGCAAMTNTSLQHLAATLPYKLFWNSLPQHSSPTLLSRNLLQHFLTAILFNTSLQHFPTTLFSTTPLYNTSLLHSSPTLPYNTLTQHFPTTLL